MSYNVAPVHERLAELWAIRKERGYLTASENDEMDMCLEVNFNIVWQQAFIVNASLVAHQANDVEWQHEICAQIDEAEGR